MSLPGFNQALVNEIAFQRQLRKRMGDDHPESQNGLMWQIRIERLSLLEKLLEFESDGGSEHG